MKKTGLGKGLDALFADNLLVNEEKEEDNSTEKIHKIKVIEIEPNRDQPRKNFDEEALEELANSIKTYGVLQPIIVNKKDNYYEIVAGERRWRAARMAEFDLVPCNIIEITDTESAEIALLENLQREDLNFIEEAEAYYNLINDHKFTQDELAKRMGKKQSTIANKLRLLKLSPNVRELCLENKLTERHTRALLSLPTEELQDILEKTFSGFKIIKTTISEQQYDIPRGDIVSELKTRVVTFVARRN